MNQDLRNYVAWNGVVLLKVLVMVWILFQNKIRTKDNLLKRGVLNEVRTRCSNGCGVDENVAHLFFKYQVSILICIRYCCGWIYPPKLQNSVRCCIFHSLLNWLVEAGSKSKDSLLFGSRVFGCCRKDVPSWFLRTKAE